MFDFFEGKLRFKSPVRVVIDVGGVGYELIIPLSTYTQLPDVNSNVRLLAHFHVSEVQQQLIGFFHEKERSLFKMLISISGVGPKLALSILSGIGADEFRKAVISGDVDTLTAISRVGRKTAERLIIELREKIVLEGETVETLKRVISPKHLVVEKDSVLALLELGFKRGDAEEAVRKVLHRRGNGEEWAADQVVRDSLKLL